MVKKTIKRAVAFLGKCLEQKDLHIEKIILFGSQVTGATTEESDIDIVIVSNDFKNKNIFDRANLTMEAEVKTIKKFMIPFDIITLTPEELESETSLIADYAKSGEVLYAA
ncbi:MAG: nucleotidyltransferase [Candidatus Scalindua rubra]|uniref:Nucleotidyltransferase n=1 Tax=Candidatus Scalindua rubra TaxID=1872076 RepID=A0A1E3XEF9_9BACT|nr:MAG: nucleotidyltransferase [Candidatus Scalindua rubra]